MKTLLQFAAAVALITVSVAVAVIASDLHAILRDTQVLVADGDLTTKHAYASVTALDVATLNLAGTLDEVKATAQNLRTASTAETAYWNATAKETSLAARDMRALVARTDRELNDHVLPDFDRELTATSTAAQFSFESLTKAGDALTFQIQDPEWGQTLHGLNVASSNGASILAHGDHVAAYYDKKLTTPLGFWKTMLHSLVPVAGAAGSVAAGFAK